MGRHKHSRKNSEHSTASHHSSSSKSSNHESSKCSSSKHKAESLSTSKNFKCEYCDYTASRSWSLRCHNKSNHPMLIVMLSCPQCKSTLGSKDVLKKHIKEQHTKGDLEVEAAFKLEHPTYDVSYIGKHSSEILF